MSGLALVCFAVPQEASAFRKRLPELAHARILITGMGSRNAERGVTAELRRLHPARVITAGFTGALDPRCKHGDVLFDTGDESLAAKLCAAGAVAGSFISSERVVITAEEKAALFAKTGAAAVEMESAAITRACRANGVPCATIRVVSDEAGEDLPLDFNALMTKGDKLSAGKLAMAIVGAPWKIPALLRLGRNSARAAESLARVLSQVV